jgi:C-1 hydroxylase
MSREDNVALVQQFFEASNKGDGAKALDELFTPSFLLNGFPFHIDEWKDLFAWARTNVPDWHHKIEDIVAEGNKVVVRLTASGTPRERWRMYKTNGQSFTSKGFFLFRIENGKIVEVWDQFNELWELQQLGALPMPEPGDAG